MLRYDAEKCHAADFQVVRMSLREAKMNLELILFGEHLLEMLNTRGSSEEAKHDEQRRILHHLRQLYFRVRHCVDARDCV